MPETGSGTGSLTWRRACGRVRDPAARFATASALCPATTGRAGTGAATGVARRVVNIRYFAPAPQLRGLISSYYWCETDLPVLADRMRAELGQVRFIVEGALRCAYDDGRIVDCPPCLVSGPTAGPVSTQAFGPFRVFGAGLMPAGWTALLGVDATELSDRVVDLEGVLGPRAGGIAEQMANARDDAMRVSAADRFFTALMSRAHAVPLWFTRLTDEWLVASPNPSVDALVAAAGMSNRQVERWTRRHYGASPKLLSRKYRALQAAVRLGTGDAATWAEAAGEAFYDQSHFIREFKQFVGVTPSCFLASAAPVTRLTIARRSLLPGMPKLALYS